MTVNRPTRRMDKRVETLGITSLCKSQVSVMAKELDTAAEAFHPWMLVPAGRRFYSH